MKLTIEPPSRLALRAHLIAARIAGEVATPRENNLSHYRRMSDREPHFLLGLQPEGSWSPAEVLALLARRCGVDPDPAHTHGKDTIDPDRTIERLEAMAARLQEAAQKRERVVVATGHPESLRPIHAAIAQALREAGCAMPVAADGWAHPDEPAYGRHRGTIAFLDGVGMLVDTGGKPEHTHSPLPIRAILAALAAAGQAPPALVVADHGWAGAAGQAGIDAIGFADSNDPALFVGEAEGRIQVCVPLDDGVAPRLYSPFTAYLLDRAGLAG